MEKNRDSKNEDNAVFNQERKSPRLFSPIIKLYDRITQFRIRVNSVYVDIPNPQDKDSASAKQDKSGSKSKHLWPVVFVSVGVVLAAAGGAGIFFAKQAATTSEQLLEKAQQYVTEEAYQKAANVYSKAIRKDETGIEAYLGLAEAALALQKPEEAIEQLKNGIAVTEDASLQASLEQLLTMQEMLDKGEDVSTLASSVPGEPENAAPAIPTPDLSVPNRVIEWKDPAMEKMVRMALGKEHGETITTYDVQTISSLKIVGKTHAAANAILQVFNFGKHYAINNTIYMETGEIKSLEDLAAFTNLTTLTVSYNQLTSLKGLESLSYLTTLGLYNNQITSLEGIENLTQLKWVYLYYNSLTDLSPIAALPSLRELWVQNNAIADLSPLSANQSLLQLHLSKNQIKSIEPLRSLPKLAVLVADDNAIVDLSPLSQTSTLVELSVVNNPIQDFTPVTQVTTIKK